MNKLLTTAAIACAMLSQLTDDGFAGNMTGKASFYADKFNGRTTANGEVFNNSRMTAASNRLKFGTYVRVTNIANGKSVIVRINDRGKFGRGVVIDLTKRAFGEIGLLTSGIVKVRLEIVEKEK